MAVNPYAVSSGSRTGLASGTSDSSVSEREDLANFISMITRDETPFMSSIGKTKATAVWHEWQTDSLAAPLDSSLSPGSDYTEVAPDFGAGTGGFEDGAVSPNNTPNRVRYGNRTQINGKTIAVSGTKRAVDQAGVADEYAYQLKKRGTELRRDLERHLLQTNQGSSNNSVVGRSFFGGVFSWLQHPIGTEVFNGPTGTVLYKNSGAASSVATAAPAAANRGEGTNGITQGSLSSNTTFELEDIDDVMQAIYEAGGSAKTVMVSPKNRRVFSAKAQASSGGLIQGGGDPNVRRNINESGSLRQSVDMYMSDFGEIMIMPNYIMGLGDNASTTSNGARGGYNASTPANSIATSFPRDFWALVYDPMWFNIATLRPLQETDVGQRGDSTVGMMVEECTLEMRNPIGCGAVYGLNGT